MNGLIPCILLKAGTPTLAPHPRSRTTLAGPLPSFILFLHRTVIMSSTAYPEIYILPRTKDDATSCQLAEEDHEGGKAIKEKQRACEFVLCVLRPVCVCVRV